MSTQESGKEMTGPGFVPWIFPNASPHCKNDCCSNEAVFDDEREEIGSGKLHNVPHDVIPAAGEVVGELDDHPGPVLVGIHS